MQARMSNPVMTVPDAGSAIQALWGCVQQSGLDPRTLILVHLRASQINGCTVCIDNAHRSADHVGETRERLEAVERWTEAACFSDAERAALALTESVTRLDDRDDPVPDIVWEQAVRHYDEPKLAALVIAIATVNVWNRLNVTTRQPVGQVWN